MVVESGLFTSASYFKKLSRPCSVAPTGSIFLCLCVMQHAIIHFRMVDTGCKLIVILSAANMGSQDPDCFVLRWGFTRQSPHCWHALYPAASLKAGGEVVMAAGATHTPQILKLSGIGPAEELRHHGIDVVRAQ